MAPSSKAKHESRSPKPADYSPLVLLVADFTQIDMEGTPACVSTGKFKTTTGQEGCAALRLLLSLNPIGIDRLPCQVSGRKFR